MLEEGARILKKMRAQQFWGKFWYEIVFKSLFYRVTQKYHKRHCIQLPLWLKTQRCWTKPR